MFRNKNKDPYSSLPEVLVNIKAEEIRQKKKEQGLAIWQQNHEDNLLEAKNYLKCHHIEVFLWRLNKRLFFLEKRHLEPLDDLIKRSAIFSIVEKISPIIEAIGIIAIPFVIWYLGEKIAAKSRQQEVINSYVNQLTQMILDADIEAENKKSKNLRRIIETNTSLILVNPNLDANGKREIINFLSKLHLITDKDMSDKKGPLISLDTANLEGVNLFGFNLEGANLPFANLKGANLKRVNLSGADLGLTNLSRANLSGANLSRAYFEYPNLFGANLSGANLYGVKGLDNRKIKLACNWDKAVYSEADFERHRYKWIPKNEQINQEIIKEIRDNKASDPVNPPICLLSK